MVCPRFSLNQAKLSQPNLAYKVQSTYLDFRSV
ncbi:hypothetical protein EMIT0194MI4_240003 [Pseudomonas sp. IT-194MI4]